MQRCTLLLVQLCEYTAELTVSVIHMRKKLGMRAGTFTLVRKNLLTGKRCHTATTNFSVSCLTSLKLTFATWV